MKSKFNVVAQCKTVQSPVGKTSRKAQNMVTNDTENTLGDKGLVTAIQMAASTEIKWVKSETRVHHTRHRSKAPSPNIQRLPSPMAHLPIQHIYTCRVCRLYIVFPIVRDLNPFLRSTSTLTLDDSNRHSHRSSGCRHVLPSPLCLHRRRHPHARRPHTRPHAHARTTNSSRPTRTRRHVARYHHRRRHPHRRPTPRSWRSQRRLGHLVPPPRSCPRTNTPSTPARATPRRSPSTRTTGTPPSPQSHIDQPPHRRPRRRNGLRQQRRRHARIDPPNELHAPMRLLVDHDGVHAVYQRELSPGIANSEERVNDTTRTQKKLKGRTSCTNLRRSGGMCGNTCVRRSEVTKLYQRKARQHPNRDTPNGGKRETHSANAFSTTPTNLGPNPLATPTNSVVYVTLPFASRFSSLMPSASASLAFRFLISHSPVQARASFVPEQGMVERRWPQGHVSVTGARQGSVSGQAAGAWHICVQGCCAGRLRGKETTREET